MKRALVTGIRGQDGTYLGRALRARGYEVVGTSRRPGPAPHADRVECWDGRDERAIENLLRALRPDEVYHLASAASGARMFEDPVGIGEANGLALVRLLEALRRAAPRARVFHASSSEVFGDARESPQHEGTARRPVSPYGAAKCYADAMLAVYRERHGVFACSGVLFNHESPLRPPEFVSRKVTQAAARIALGRQQRVLLGDLDALRDWGFAGDTMEAAWTMLQADAPDDYVVATGVAHSVRDLCRIAFERVGLDWQRYVEVDPALLRPPETVPRVGDARKLRTRLGWAPQVDFARLVAMMVDADLELERRSDGAGGIP